MNGSRAWLEKDFYAALGVEERATADEIKRAYKKLARQFHPDRNPGDAASEERMKDISEAYDVLSDAAKRQEYDQVRRLARSGYAGGAPGAGWQSNIRVEDVPFDLGDLGDVFGGIFGGAGRGRRRARRGSDLEASVRVGFEDALRGTTVGVQGVAGPVKAKIPAGIRDGARIRLRGHGAPGPDGNGDLYVTVEVSPHERYRREGDDLVVIEPVPFTSAVLGGTIGVDTLEGPVTLKIPAGTSSGRTFRVRGRGAPRDGGRGDLLVTVHVSVPKHLSEEQRDLIERLAEIDGTRAPKKAPA